MTELNDIVLHDFYSAQQPPDNVSKIPSYPFAHTDTEFKERLNWDSSYFKRTKEESYYIYDRRYYARKLYTKLFIERYDYIYTTVLLKDN